jgi:hypothetical protein
MRKSVSLAVTKPHTAITKRFHDERSAMCGRNRPSNFRLLNLTSAQHLSLVINSHLMTFSCTGSVARAGWKKV